MRTEDIWNKICDCLRKELGEDIFMSWIHPINFIDLQNNSLVFGVPSIFMRNWILTHYADKIFDLWKKHIPDIQNIDFSIELSAPIPQNNPVFEEIDKAEDETLDRRFVFENFVVGKSNEFAYAAARRVSEAQTPPFNPLFLYGGVGLGKTHLMHSISWYIQNNYANKRVLYISAEKFMHEFIKAMRYKNTEEFKERFRSVDCLMIDDVQFIGGKESTQEEFFHTFNAIVDNNRQIIVSADKSPFDLEKVEERLKSRLGWGLIADIHETTFELRLGILQSKIEKIGLDIPLDVLEFLALKITSNIRELEGALNRIAAHTILIQRKINLEMVQSVLKDVLKNSTKHISVEDIQKRVCEYYNIRLFDMISKNRTKDLARARQIAMFLSKDLTDRSFPDIGKRFGGRDHTTVLHACRNINQLIAKEEELRIDVDVLKKSLKG